MEYALIIWTIVGVGGNSTFFDRQRDWRPIAVFHDVGTVSALDMCKNAAMQLGIKTARYRCIKTK